jgi:hypothetical protein
MQSPAPESRYAVAVLRDPAAGAAALRRGFAGEAFGVPFAGFAAGAAGFAALGAAFGVLFAAVLPIDFAGADCAALFFFMFFSMTPFRAGGVRNQWLNFNRRRLKR